MLRAVLGGMLCLCLALPAAADEQSGGGGLIHELKIGAQVHDVPYMWSGFHREPYSVDLNLEAQFSPSVAFLGGRLRPALGATINFEGYTSKAYLDARWQRDCDYNMFYALGLGIAVHDGETFTSDREFKQLGRRVLFHPNAEIGFRLSEHQTVSVFFEHISNASTESKNQGLDTLGLRLGYRF
jgi:lipid A 3-O-deacylase